MFKLSIKRENVLVDLFSFSINRFSGSGTVSRFTARCTVAILCSYLLVDVTFKSGVIALLVL